jgi:hypothetical protein
MKKSLIIGFSLVFVLFTIYIILGRQIPIHRSDYKIDSLRIYYKETSRMIQCDIAYFEVVVYEDNNYRYIYELISIGNGSCMSELYVWHEFQFYKLSEAIAANIVSIDDFLESDLVKKSPIVLD